MNSVQGECSGPAFVPASLRGYRSWNAHRTWASCSVPPSSIGLYAITGPSWERTLEAQCLMRHVFCSCDDCRWGEADAKHPAPGPDCVCGIYGYYDPVFLGIEVQPTYGCGFYGVIEAAGRILVGTKGFRAQRARVVAVAPWEHPTLCYRGIAGVAAKEAMEEAIPYLREAGIEVYPTFQDIVDTYPPEDYEAMIRNLREGSDSE